MADFDPRDVPPDAGLTLDEAESIFNAAVTAFAATKDTRPLFAPEVVAAAVLLAALRRASYLAAKSALVGAWRDLESLVRAAPKPGSAGALPPGYHEVNAGIVHVVVRQGEATPVPLTNFLCRIERQRLRDDGASRQRRYELRAEVAGERRHFEVSADEFRGLNWIERDLGAGALVYPTHGVREHLPHAIKQLSEPVEEAVTYGHTGWRELGDRWLFLHAGGALGPDGPVDGISCSPGFGAKARLAAFCMPAPVAGDRLPATCTALARMVEVFPKHPEIGLSQLCAGLRAPFGFAPYALSLVGTTGSGKSTIAAAAQNMYAPSLTGTSLPLSWQDTSTTLEGGLFWLRDVLTVVDDFAPEGSRREQSRVDLTFARLSRAIGNHSSRGRSNADLSARPDRPPMGMPVFTLEFSPAIASQVARAVQVDVPAGAFNSGVLTLVQAEAMARAEATSTLICRMAGDPAAWLARFAAIRDELRADARPKLSAVHARTPDNLADLGAGLRVGLELLPELAGLVDFDVAWQMLLALGEAQAGHVRAGDQALLFLRFIRSALSSKAAHISPARHPEDQPDEDEADSLGWSKIRAAFTPENTPERAQPATFRANPPRIGWIDGNFVYLDPASAYAKAEELAAKSGVSLGIGEHALWRMLGERGLLVRLTKGRNTSLVTIGGFRRWVICVPAASVLGAHVRAGNGADATPRSVGCDEIGCSALAVMTGPHGNWCGTHLEPRLRQVGNCLFCRDAILASEAVERVDAGMLHNRCSAAWHARYREAVEANR